MVPRVMRIVMGSAPRSSAVLWGAPRLLGRGREIVAGPLEHVVDVLAEQEHEHHDHSGDRCEEQPILDR
jgi:hypothetical protein